MIKVIGLMTRRPGMSHQEFRDYYESRHRVIGEKVLSGYASRYFRRYLTPSHGRATTAEAPVYDCILEIWYPDQAAADAAREGMSLPEVAKEILEDEERLFDRDKLLFYFAEDVESTLS